MCNKNCTLFAMIEISVKLVIVLDSRCEKSPTNPYLAEPRFIPFQNIVDPDLLASNKAV